MIIYGKISKDEQDDMLCKMEFMKKKQHILKVHPYKIYFTEKSGWFTTVDTQNGKKKIRKKTEEALLDALEAVYFEKNIQTIYKEWIDLKTTPCNSENISRIERDWRRYYENEPLSQDLIQKPITSINSMELRLWAKDMLCKYRPNVKQYHRMIYPISQVFAYASDEDVGILDQDLWQRAKKKIDRNLIKPTPVPEDETQVFTDEERLLLRQMVIEDLEKYDYNPTSAGLQILLMLESGIRIGEACGLKWEDIVDGYIRIRRQADNNRVKLPKTAAAIRDIPLTDEAIRVLEMVRQYNEKHGLSGEWVFLNTDPNKYEGRLSYHAADRKLRKLCERMQAAHRSPHKLRKTFASLLKNSNVVTDRNIQRAMGHANISTTMNCYVFDQHKKEEQVESIKRALELERPDE